MSYDYDALVSSIASLRRKAREANTDADRLEHLQAATEKFESLSSHCPMTPLLWIQYARTAFDFMCLASSTSATGNSQEAEAVEAMHAAATELRLQTLELGLQEFPGSCLLQVHYANLMIHSSQGVSLEKKDQVLKEALEAVGRGSHRNEGPWVVVLYHLLALVWASELNQTTKNNRALEQIQQVFVQRSRAPMKDANDSLEAAYRGFCGQYRLPENEETVAAMEEGRRLESRVFGRFVALEDEIDAAMHQEGVLARHMIQPVVATTPVVPEEWELQLELPTGQQFGMGLGSASTATAFVKYALALSKFTANQKKRARRKNKRVADDDQADPDQLELERSMPSLALSVYERGVAECPTAESLWLSYIRCLLEMIQDNLGNTEGTKTALLATRLQSVSRRAVRNCPYSQTLVEQQLHVAFVLAQHGLSILDPDKLLETVQNALDKKFLPGPAPFLALYLLVIRIVKRRILHLLTTPLLSTDSEKGVTFDEAEALSSTSKTGPKSLSDDAKQELKDLLEDAADLFVEVEERLQKTHGSWTEGRALLWRERAYSESLLLNPLRSALQETASENNTPDSSKTLDSFERAIRVSNPPHPDSYLSYVRQYASLTQTSDAFNVASKLRRIRDLYQRGVNSVGRPKPGSSFTDFDVALSNLCNEWIEFESFFGSPRSIGRAKKAIQRKLQKSGTSKLTPTQTSEVQETTEMIAKKEGVSPAVEPPTKKQKIEKPPSDVVVAMPAESATEVAAVVAMDDGTITRTPRFKAHPFTVRVSSLDPATEDMDLVDIFRAKCGPIVHAKIMREKHHHHGKGPSKGWGLVQFEERESVVKALALDGVLGVHQMIAKIEPSHMPAVALVPPGMHRVKPKGEGKSSKRNLTRKEQKKKDKTVVDASASTDTGAKKPNETKKQGGQKTESSILAFRPRGVGRHRKVQFNLDKKSPEKNTSE